MKKAVFAGTFDPFTLGHYDIVVRARDFFDRVVVAVATDTGKAAMPLADRLEITKLSLSGLSNTEVVTFSGLLTDFLKKESPCVLIRGLRCGKDFEYERELERIYKSQCDIDIIYLMTAPQFAHVSSSAVRTLAALSGNIDGYVSSNAKNKIISLYGKKGDGKNE